MLNIGFVEKNDNEKTQMIKFLVDSAKGISTIKITKEANPMTEETTQIVENVEVAPEAQPAEVIETPAVVEEAPVAEAADAEKSIDGSAESSIEKSEEREVVAEEIVIEETAELTDEVVAEEIVSEGTDEVAPEAAAKKDSNEKPKKK
jgi:hypothetical protein